jgi:cyclohexanone monooxygenase
MLANSFEEIEAIPEAENERTEHVADVGSKGLFSMADSWYFGANISGKKREALNPSRTPNIQTETVNSVGEGYSGFQVS